MSVYLPPGYDATRATPYPTLYLSHGAGGNDTDWTTQGVAQNILDNAIAAGAAPAQVVVSTDFNGLPGGAQGYADELRTNVIPFIEANYRVSKARADRAFGGLSAGGGRALTLLYDNTDLFGSYGAWSAASALQAPTTEQAARMKAVPGVIHFGTGLQDFLANINANSVSRAAALRAADVPVVERNLNGIHSWDVWRQLLDDYVRTAAFRSTTTTLSAPATAVAGQATTLKATVASVSPSVARPTGSVTFYATRGGQQTVIGTAPVGSDGTAQLNDPLGATGAVQVSASYQGSTAANASSSAPAAVSVTAAQGTAKAGLKVKVTPKKASVRGPRVRLTATVKASGARPSGTVSFRLRGGKTLGEQELSRGRATVKLPRGLEAGSYTVVVTYSGDTVYAAGRTTVKVVLKRR